MGSSETGQKVLRKHSSTMTSPSLIYPRRNPCDNPLAPSVEHSRAQASARFKQQSAPATSPSRSTLHDVTGPRTNVSANSDVKRFGQNDSDFSFSSPLSLLTSYEEVATAPSSTPGPTQSPQGKILCIDRKKSESSEIGSVVKRFSKASISNSDKVAEKVFSKTSMSEECSWRLVAAIETLRRAKCRRLYAKLGQEYDLALFYKRGAFFAMDAWCSHMGGPLYEGDIEDYNGSLHVLCPWHAYMFDVKSGRSEIGLEQKVFQVKIESGNVYINYNSELSLYPYL